MRADQPLEMIISRLTYLEQAHRQWKLAGLAAEALLGLVVLLAATGRQESMPIEEVRASRALLVDAEERRRSPPAVACRQPPALGVPQLAQRPWSVRTPAAPGARPAAPPPPGRV
jgi:hypothetical protein